MTGNGAVDAPVTLVLSAGDTFCAVLATSGDIYLLVWLAPSTLGVPPRPPRKRLAGGRLNPLEPTDVCIIRFGSRATSCLAPGWRVSVALVALAVARRTADVALRRLGEFCDRSVGVVAVRALVAFAAWAAVNSPGPYVSAWVAVSGVPGGSRPLAGQRAADAAAPTRRACPMTHIGMASQGSVAASAVTRQHDEAGDTTAASTGAGRTSPESVHRTEATTGPGADATLLSYGAWLGRPRGVRRSALLDGMHRVGGAGGCRGSGAAGQSGRQESLGVPPPDRTGEELEAVDAVEVGPSDLDPGLMTADIAGRAPWGRSGAELGQGRSGPSAKTSRSASDRRQ